MRIVVYTYTNIKNDRRNSGGTLRQRVNLIDYLTFDIQPMYQWNNGKMDQWTNGLMDQWPNRLLDYGPKYQWNNEQKDQWTNGTMDPWTHRPMDP